jgi:hypothetical protein
MARRIYKPEEIMAKLRQVVSNGRTETVSAGRECEQYNVKQRRLCRDSSRRHGCRTRH